MSARILVAYGTRPERIKLAPVVDALRERGVDFVEWCSGQQRDLAGSSEHGMRKELWEAGLTCGIANCLDEFEKVVQRIRPACVIVQGDTATAFACAQPSWRACPSRTSRRACAPTRASPGRKRRFAGK
jgi:UDP-N-acetylglucosamine 2-epimerase (non-hydrolysing)